MGDVISLSEYRKKRARDERARKARDNRARHGRTGAEKAAGKVNAEKAARDLDQKRLGSGADDGADRDTSREPPEGTTPTAG